MKIYTLPENESADFTVTVNGIHAPVYECFVSKDPINRRWPGHQRETSQREKAYFVSFEHAGNAEVEIAFKNAFGAAVVRPLAKNVTPRADANTVRFTLTEHGGYSFEVDGPHGALHLFFNPPANYFFSPNENVLHFEHGVFDAGEIYLKSNQTLYIAEDAVVYANIVSESEENIRICGRGVLDNSRSKEKILFEAAGDGQTDAGNAERKHFISLIHCKNISIDGVILRDSLFYNISAADCEQVHVNNLKIIGCWRYNSDGVDLQNCRNCTLTNSFLRTYDDCTCIKGDVKYGTPCTDTLVENCVLWCDWGHALEIGYETCAEEIKNITYRNCCILRTNFDFLNIGCVDYADIHDILYENIALEFTGDERRPQYQNADGETYEESDAPYAPELIGAGVFRHFEYSVGNRFGSIRRVTYKNLNVTNAREIKVHFSGANENHKVQDITIENLRVNGRKIQSFDELNADCNFTENIKII